LFVGLCGSTAVLFFNNREEAQQNVPRAHGSALARFGGGGRDAVGTGCDCIKQFVQVVLSNKPWRRKRPGFGDGMNGTTTRDTQVLWFEGFYLIDITCKVIGSSE
jgi:hypothetical protein